MSSIAKFSTIVVALCLAAVALPAQTLKLQPKRGQTAHVDVKVKINGKLQHIVDGREKKEKLEIERHLEYVDEVSNTGSSERVKFTFDGRRSYLRYELEENKRVMDHPLSGCSMDVSMRDDGQIEIKPDKDRRMSQEQLNAEARRVGSIGFATMNDIILGETPTRIDIFQLAPLLVAAPEQVDSAPVMLSLIENDEEKGIMKIGGPLKFSHGRRGGGADVGWNWDLQVVFLVDTQANRLIGAETTGTLTGSGSNRQGQVSFEAEVSSEVEVDIEPKVKKLLRKKRKQRRCDFEAGDTGITFQLPHTFFYYGFDSERGYHFLSMAEGAISQRSFFARFMRTADAKGKVDEFVAPRRGQAGFEVEKASMKGARGYSVFGPTEDKKSFIFEEWFVAKEGVIRVVYAFPAREEKEGRKEMKRIRKSLRYDP